MPSPGSILRQLSGRQTGKSPSKQRRVGNNYSFNHTYNNSNFNYSCTDTTAYNGQGSSHWGQINGYSSYDSYYYNSNRRAPVVKKRVMVVVDKTSRSKHAVMWALNQVVNDGDMLTLLQVMPIHHGGGGSSSDDVARSLGSLCKAYKPQVEVEALMIQGPKLATVLSQVKKLEVSVLVLGQKKPSPLINCLFGSSGGSSSDEFVEQCINNAECLTVGVRKQSRGMGGYLITTRSQKNFWLLA